MAIFDGCEVCGSGAADVDGTMGFVVGGDVGAEMGLAGEGVVVVMMGVLADVDVDETVDVRAKGPQRGP